MTWVLFPEFWFSFLLFFLRFSISPMQFTSSPETWPLFQNAFYHLLTSADVHLYTDETKLLFVVILWSLIYMFLIELSWYIKSIWNCTSDTNSTYMLSGVLQFALVIFIPTRSFIESTVLKQKRKPTTWSCKDIIMSM